MEDRIQKLEKEVESLKERNRRVEGDKAWEMSNFRSFSLTFATYLVSAIILKMIEREHFLEEALVPALGYYLSTLSLPAIKRWWIGRSN